MSRLHLRRHEIKLLPESARVILRPFIPGEVKRVSAIIERALALPENEVSGQLSAIRQEFESRHFDITSVLNAHFERVRKHVNGKQPLSRERELLIGALF